MNNSPKIVLVKDKNGDTHLVYDYPNQFGKLPTNYVEAVIWYLKTYGTGSE
jgi:hypothetical protein